MARTLALWASLALTSACSALAQTPGTRLSLRAPQSAPGDLLVIELTLAVPRDQYVRVRLDGEDEPLATIAPFGFAAPSTHTIVLPGSIRANSDVRIALDDEMRSGEASARRATVLSAEIRVLPSAQ